jgi:hypothetical protein
MGAAVAAIVVRRQRDMVQTYRGVNATSPERAREPGEIGLEQDMIFKGLVRRAVLRDAGGGRYYLDEPSWQALRRTRHRLALVILAIVLLLGALVFTGVIGTFAARQ